MSTAEVWLRFAAALSTGSTSPITRETAEQIGKDADTMLAEYENRFQPTTQKEVSR